MKTPNQKRRKLPLVVLEARHAEDKPELIQWRRYILENVIVAEIPRR
jgi:hypothetical protein